MIYCSNFVILATAGGVQLLSVTAKRRSGKVRSTSAATYGTLVDAAHSRKFCPVLSCPALPCPALSRLWPADGWPLRSTTPKLDRALAALPLAPCCEAPLPIQYRNSCHSSQVGDSLHSRCCCSSCMQCSPPASPPPAAAVSRACPSTSSVGARQCTREALPLPSLVMRQRS